MNSSPSISPLLRQLLIILPLLLSSGCIFGSNGYLRDELANSGPIALSPDNPYLASNLFLAHESDRSPLLKGFLAHRGTPNVIEVKKRTLRPYIIYLYYLDTYEIYRFEEHEGDWIIHGPDGISESKLLKLPNRFPSKSSRAPLLTSRDLRGKPSAQIDVTSGEYQTSVREDKIEDIPTAAAKKRQQAIAYESPSGDIIHRVTFSGETMRIIAKWYTGDYQNVKRLSRINGIREPDHLLVGQLVRIPRYLLRTTESLPQSETLK